MERYQRDFIKGLERQVFWRGQNVGKTELLRREMLKAPVGSKLLIVSPSGNREVHVVDAEVVESKPLPRKELVHDQP